MVQRTRFGKYLWLGLVLAGTASCGPTNDCTTTRNVMVVGWVTPIEQDLPLKWQDCSGIQKMEDVLVENLPQFDPINLNGFRVFIQNPGVKTDPWGREVSGYTTCNPKVIVIWDDGLFLGDTALPHELAHGLQNCAAKLPLDPEWKGEWWAQDHADWYREHIWEAIEKARYP